MTILEGMNLSYNNVGGSCIWTSPPIKVENVKDPAKGFNRIPGTNVEGDDVGFTPLEALNRTPIDVGRRDDGFIGSINLETVFFNDFMQSLTKNDWKD